MLQEAAFFPKEPNPSNTLEYVRIVGKNRQEVRNVSMNIIIIEYSTCNIQYSKWPAGT